MIKILSQLLGPVNTDKITVLVFQEGNLLSVLAGAPGFEPGSSVLETDVLAVGTMPLQGLMHLASPRFFKMLLRFASFYFRLFMYG